MKYYAKGKEITEKEFSAIKNRNKKLISEYERTGSIDLLTEVIFLTMVYC
jgi:hypothetical protein